MLSACDQLWLSRASFTPIMHKATCSGSTGKLKITVQTRAISPNSLAGAPY